MRARVFICMLGIGLGMGCCTQDLEPKPNPTPTEFKYPSYFGVPEIPADNPLTNEGIALGRRLFYEKRLSSDHKISCGSCHQQSKAFSDGRKVSLGVEGKEGEMNAMSLVNLAWSSKFFWNGRTESLEEQALEPIQHPKEMGLTLKEAEAKLQESSEYPELFEKAFGSRIITAENITKSLAQFQRTLVSASSRYDSYLRGESELNEMEEWGMELFFTHPEPGIQLRGANCGDCHLGVQVSGSSDGYDGFHNNGLDIGANLQAGLFEWTGNSNDKGKFKAPSLRNIALTAPYMHDGRFQTLSQVLDHYDEHIKVSSTLSPLIREASNESNLPEGQIQLKLTEAEKQAIIVFLHSLTDSAFIENPDFSNPFE